MNTEVLFYHPTSEKFNQGENWISSSGTPVAVIGVEKYPGSTDERVSEYGVTYTYYENGKLDNNA